MVTKPSDKTIITVSLRLKKYNWTESFISEHTKFLNTSQKENALNYNLASVYYEKGDTKAALRILNIVQFTDVFNNLDAWILLIKIYFDNPDFKAVYTSIVACRAFLKRNKSVSKTQKELYLNFLKMTQKLMRILEKPNSHSREKKQLEKVIKNTQILPIKAG